MNRLTSMRMAGGLAQPGGPPAGPPGGHPARWLVPLVILGGALVTVPHLAPYGAEFLWLAVSAVVASAILLTRVRRVSVGSLPVWLLLGAFLLGYFVKFYLMVGIAAAPSAVSYFAITPDRLVYASAPETAVESFRLAVAGFWVFCIVFAVLPMPGGANGGPHLLLTRARMASRVRTLLVVAGVLLVVTTAVALALGAFVMGTTGDALPFRLLGILFYSRTVGLVLLGLTVMQVGLLTQTPAWTRAAVILLVLFAATEILVRSTRGSFVLVALGLALMIVVVRGRVEKSAARIFAGLFAVALLLYPVITQYRRLRRDSDSGAELFTEALRLATRDSSVGDIFWSGVASMLTRFIGIDSLLYLTRSDTWIGPERVLAYNLAGGSVATYFTQTVVGVPPTQVHAEAPSLLGWFLIAGGWWGLTVGLAVFFAVAWWVWRRLWDARLAVKPVAQVQYLLFWLTLSSDGTLDSVVMQIPVMLAAFPLLETILRWGGALATEAPRAELPGSQRGSRLAPHS